MTDEPDRENARELMDHAWRARREGNYPEAHSDMLQAIELLRKAGAHDELVTALGRLGHIEMDQEHWTAARAVYKEAIRICREANDVLGLAHKTRHLGDVHRHTGRERDARECYDDSLSLYRSHGEPPKLDLANAIRMVAESKEDLGQLEEAKQLWREARELYGALGLQEGVEESSEHLAKLER